MKRRNFFKLSATATAGLALSASTQLKPTNAKELNSESPNILLILVDDLGYGDLSAYGADDLQTPHVDELISEMKCNPNAVLLDGRRASEYRSEHVEGTENISLDYINENIFFQQNRGVNNIVALQVSDKCLQVRSCI